MFVFVCRMKGEENTVMRDYVLPDFSTIKKGFCKVMSDWSLECSSYTHMHLTPCYYLVNSSFFLYLQPREEMVYSGKYKTGEQILRLANERFAVPEILFQPSDIGIQEMGIPEAIVHSIQSLPEGQLAQADRKNCVRVRLRL